MPTSKKKPTKEKRPAAPAPPATPRSEPAETYDPSKDRRALQELIARHGQVSAAHRAAFDSLIDDDGRAELGAKTRAAGVFREGVAWTVIIDHAFRDYPALVQAHYAKERFAYFLDRLGALDAAISAQVTRRGDQGTTRSTAAQREEAAREARKRLISKLKGVAGARSAERAALAEATGTTEDTDALGTSIQALVALARAWLSRSDDASQILCAAAGLTPAVVDAALAAGEALTGAAKDATLAGRRRGVDAPEVNLVEGSVLHEMEEAARCFEEANAATKLIPRLVPGPATRNALGPKKPAAKRAAPPPTGAAPTPAKAGTPA